MQTYSQQQQFFSSSYLLLYTESALTAFAEPLRGAESILLLYTFILLHTSIYILYAKLYLFLPIQRAVCGKYQPSSFDFFASPSWLVLFIRERKIQTAWCVYCSKRAVLNLYIHGWGLSAFCKPTTDFDRSEKRRIFRCSTGSASVLP